MAWKPPSLFFAATVRKSSIVSAANAQAAQRARRHASAFMGAGNDEHDVTLGLGPQVDDDKDSDKNSHRAALS
ncbi:hypothetical protein C4K19_3618 [Pseudomonas chlororaphis subsp. aurantiaca]|nr:hypothetical protein C4K19_3618 [Pseudomonas chlororaphis subsp. aurantiaca]AZD80201.1 hypothetical protein C4K15_3636 [Pseudomonas chlororaphis subsp. aurantiaca]